MTEADRKRRIRDQRRREQSSTTAASVETLESTAKSQSTQQTIESLPPPTNVQDVTPKTRMEATPVNEIVLYLKDSPEGTQISLLPQWTRFKVRIVSKANCTFTFAEIFREVHEACDKVRLVSIGDAYKLIRTRLLRLPTVHTVEITES
jgi:spore cortex formation protein SpoVR/YcgB (stage V sporulation)